MLDRLSFPQPYLSLILFTVWQFLSDGVSGASVVMGLALAWMIPQLTRGFWPDPPFFTRPWKLPPYLVLVLYDILVSSVSVARLILSGRDPRPILVSYPLELTHPLAISMLASTISLTPGTVSADVSDDRTLLLIHALDAESDDEVINAIRTRYEARLKEMFQ
ncbi:MULTISPECIES: Na+/H+ antiporter subunit E [Marinobacter]|jgi:multicomponent K+:H+ antiporter subunit E|uniref:Na+/H+ antiporter subunit E n=1 Tax=Marinobacter TaxID=2742 RepID=UPI000FCCBAE0|nr:MULTISPECIES: Na+/H+ antiporter subunit E [Marinobacter]MCZ4283225.1 Na+/H+ antiporter subunit E [Marinobacter salarius]MDM8179719.1 Na+/H+ antiporter subunit E [Marinobacter salarius]RUT75465.1 Na+/H+ antiporter subunit E [Marinobacter sp. NP-6]|tara:strand:+ start:1025 stop:1513 length:489 start_codon:yes stop_codon:yes gene_type:complete